MIREVIEWHDVGEMMPDEDVTVLILVPTLQPPVWVGWHANGLWFVADGSDLNAETEKVERWAVMPKGEAT